ncbi:hypothetical protein [Anaeromyxobacter paludicola]|uniref:hypothetical protein n=1 Tax=Anaeromyxobacter paludicola TaxID=2918171 RepID=UPI0020C0116A|nr:hypothetical protein [Anaeromyxobacter paludicola]
MNALLSSDLAALSDHALLEALVSLVRREREATAELVAHLAEVDARRALPQPRLPLDALLLRERAPPL